MQIHRIQPEELPAVFELLSTNGWAQRLGGLQRFAALIEASQIASVAQVEGRVVGFVRGITDGLSNGYLSMLVVAADRRGQGIGRALVEQAIGNDPDISWVLRAGREGAAAFFARVGFEPSSLAMERRRRQSPGA